MMRGLGCRLVLTVAIGAALAACGGSEEAIGGLGSETSKSTGGSSQIMRLAEPRFGDFDMMVEKRVIRVVSTLNRTNYFLDAGTPRGATYEGLMQFEKFVNERLGTGRLKVHVVIVPVARDELLPALVDGRADIAVASLTVTPDRLEKVEFSDAVMSDVSEVIVTGPGAPQLKTIDDLADQELFVRRSSSYYESLRALSDAFHQRGLTPIRIQEVDERLETEDILELVAAGVFPMTVADDYLAEFWQEIFDGAVVRSDLAVGTGRSVAWAFRKDSPRLAAEINAFIKGHRKGTLFGNILLKRYFSEAKQVRNPLSGAELERLLEYEGYFEKYAEQYGLDWILVAAQAFQESRLDQSLKSNHGAVGIMQIKPTTAADKNVGITDVSTAENNIHAGMKYLRFVRDRYFKDEGMDQLNQMFFALAAYNAGPARVADFREQAKAKGLDPNVWFRQTEQVAVRQTVDYVSNIFKYYIAYREYFDRRERLQEIKGK